MRRKELEEVSLTPHHAVKIIDSIASRRVLIGRMRILGRGTWEGETRAKDLVRAFRRGTGRVHIVLPTRKDYVCAGEPEDVQCFGLTNGNLTGCTSLKKTLRELRIAMEMGITIGKTYDIADLKERRERTSYGRE